LVVAAYAQSAADLFSVRPPLLAMGMVVWVCPLVAARLSALHSYAVPSRPNHTMGDKMDWPSLSGAFAQCVRVRLAGLKQRESGYRDKSALEFDVLLFGLHSFAMVGSFQWIAKHLTNLAA